jgi:hypothetical protein
VSRHFFCSFPQNLFTHINYNNLHICAKNLSVNLIRLPIISAVEVAELIMHEVKSLFVFVWGYLLFNSLTAINSLCKFCRAINFLIWYLHCFTRLLFIIITVLTAFMLCCNNWYHPCELCPFSFNVNYSMNTNAAWIENKPFISRPVDRPSIYLNC